MAHKVLSQVRNVFLTLLLLATGLTLNEAVKILIVYKL